MCAAMKKVVVVPLLTVFLPVEGVASLWEGVKFCRVGALRGGDSQGEPTLATLNISAPGVAAAALYAPLKANSVRLESDANTLRKLHRCEGIGAPQVPCFFCLHTVFYCVKVLRAPSHSLSISFRDLECPACERAIHSFFI